MSYAPVGLWNLSAEPKNNYADEIFIKHGLLSPQLNKLNHSKFTIRSQNTCQYLLVVADLTFVFDLSHFMFSVNTFLSNYIMFVTLLRLILIASMQGTRAES